MSDIEMAAFGAAVDVLCKEGDSGEETLALAQCAAYDAAVTAGASRTEAAELSLRLVTEVTLIP